MDAPREEGVSGLGSVRMTRRQALGRVAALGLGAPALLSVLDSCGSSTSGATQTLQLYSSVDYAQPAAVNFGKKMGVKVNNYNDDAGVVLARIAAEGSHPLADVYLLSDAEGMEGLAQQGHLLPYISPERSGLTALALEVSDAGGQFTAVALSAAAAFTYNTKTVTGSAIPTDWPDLLKSTFKDSLSMPDPIFSGPTYGTIFGILQMMGESAGWDYWRKVVANGLKIYTTNTPTLLSVESGGRKVAVNQDTASYYDMVVSKAPIAINYPTSGTILQGDAVGIEVKSTRQKLAKQFVDYMLSPQGQTDSVVGTAAQGKGVSGDQWAIPVRPGIAIDPARVTTGINWLVINLKQAAEQEASIKARFKALAGG